MKQNLLAICLIALSSINLQASTLPETILQDPMLFAVTGYIAGNLGYQVLNGRNLNPLVKFSQKLNGIPFTLEGIQCMGLSVYGYSTTVEKSSRKSIKIYAHNYNDFIELTKNEGCDISRAYDIAQCTNEKLVEIDCNGPHIYLSRTAYFENIDKEKEDQLAASLYIDLRPIAAGIITSGLCAGIAYCAAKK